MLREKLQPRCFDRVTDMAVVRMRRRGGWAVDSPADSVLAVAAWSTFFLAVAGAAAALAGLVIVAASVNIAQIIKYPQLPPRAGAAIGSLVLALLVGIAGLADQPALAFGVEAACFGLVAWVLHARGGQIAVRANRASARPLSEAVRVVVLGQAQTLPVIVGAILIACGAPAGFYVLFAGIIAVFALTMFDAWVLLVEILR